MEAVHAKVHHVILTNPTDGREGDYNAWNENRHLELAVTGFVGAQRFRAATEAMSISDALDIANAHAVAYLGMGSPRRPSGG
jgi:hypothetical protein